MTPDWTSMPRGRSFLDAHLTSSQDPLRRALGLLPIRLNRLLAKSFGPLHPGRGSSSLWIAPCVERETSGQSWGELCHETWSSAATEPTANSGGRTRTWCALSSVSTEPSRRDRRCSTIIVWRYC